MALRHFLSLFLISLTFGLNGHLVSAQESGSSYVRFVCESISSNEILNSEYLQKTGGHVIFEQEFINEEGCQLTTNAPFVKVTQLPCTGENVKNNLVNTDFRYFSSSDISFKVTLYTDTKLKLHNKTEQARSRMVDQMLETSGHKPYSHREKSGYVNGVLDIRNGNVYTFREKGGRGFEINGFYDVNFTDHFQINLYSKNRDGVKYSSALETFVCYPPELIETNPASSINPEEKAVE